MILAMDERMSPTMTTVALIVLLVPTIWRVTRLLVVEEFPPFRILREWIIDHFGDVTLEGELRGGKWLGGLGWAIAYVWTCPWCMSIYVGAGLVALTTRYMSVPMPWLIVAVGSLVSGWAHNFEAGFDQRWKLRERELKAGEREPRPR